MQPRSHRTTVTRHPSGRASEWDIVFFILLCFVFQSKIVWYDFRSLAAQGGYEFELSTSFLYWSLALLPVVVYFLIKQLPRHMDDPFCVVLLGINFYGLAVGIISGNSLLVISQDVWKYLFPLVGYLAGSAVLQQKDSAYPLTILFYVTVLAMVVRFGYFYLERGGIFDLRYGGVAELFAVSFAVASIAGSRASAIKWSVFLVAIFLLIAVGQKRTVIFLSGAMILTLLPMLAAQRRVISIFVFLFPLAVIAVLSMAFFGDLDFASLQDTFTKLTSRNLLDISGEVRRTLEVEVIWQMMVREPVAFLFGFGSGAEFQLPTFHRPTLEETFHSVHFTPAAMLYRHGLAGVLVYVWVALCLIRLRPRVQTSELRTVTIAASLYKIAAFISSFTIYGVMDDILIGVCTASLLNVKRQKRASYVTHS